MSMTYTETLITTHCWCGIALAVPKALYDHAKDDAKNGIYCPLGHTFVFRDDYKSKLEKERVERERAEKRARANLELLRHEERSHAATRGHLTRTKKRVGNGVCPCCNRHFTNLERHMHTKHPDYATTTT